MGNVLDAKLDAAGIARLTNTGEGLAESRKQLRAAAREKAMEELYPKALAVLNEQMDSLDERVRQTAALKVLEYEWGKPTQPVEQSAPAVIIFEAAYIQPRPE